MGKFLRQFLYLDFYTSFLTGANNFKTLFVILAFSLIFSIQPAYYTFKNVYPVVSNLEERVRKFVEDVYPQELEINIKNGTVSTNVTEPFFITARSADYNNLFNFGKDEASSRIRLLAIDTKAHAEDFERYQAMALLTEDSLVYFQDGYIKIQSLRGISEFKVDKGSILGLIQEYSGKLNINIWLKVLVFASPLAIFIFQFLSQMFFYLFLALLVLVIIKIMKVKASFKNIFRFVVVCSVIPNVIWYVAWIVPVVLGSTGMFSSYLKIGILAIAYSAISKIGKTTNLEV